jgi:succinoglycan biosynthesis transport protein ExoP
MLAAPGQEFTLRDFGQLLLRRKKILIGVAITVFVLSVTTSLMMKHKYTSTSTIQMQKSSSDGLNLESMMGDSGGGTADSLTANLELQTQASILASDGLALRVIEELHLEDRPEFHPPPTILGRIEGLFQAKHAPEPVTIPLDQTRFRRAAMLVAFDKNLGVRVIPGTRLLQVSYTDLDPELAAEVANHLVHELSDYTFQTRFNATADVSKWLGNQLGDLRQQTEDLQAQVVAMQKETGLFGVGAVDPQGRPVIFSPTLDTLEQTTNALTQAQSNLVIKGAIAQVVRTGDPELISQLSGTSIASGGNPGVSNSLGLLQSLRSQEETLEQQIDHDSSIFGPDYPRLKEEKAAMAAVSQSLKQESGRLATRAENDYRVAQTEEAGAQQAFDTQRAAATKLNDKTIAYTILQREATQSEELYQDLLRRLKEAGILEGLHSSNITVVDLAHAPAMPSQPNRRLYAIGGLIFGIILGIIAALVFDAVDNQVRSMDDLDAIGLPMLGILPNFGSSVDSRLMVAEKPNSQFAENMRNVRSSLFLSRSGHPPQVILVTSSTPGEGKTTVAMNLSASLAQQGKKVLLIEADLRRPTMQKKLQMKSDAPGLSDVLAGSAEAKPVAIESQPGLSILFAGRVPPLPAELVGSASMEELVREMRKLYDLIVIDSPPILPVADARAMAHLADATLLVARVDLTSRAVLARGYNTLRQSVGDAPSAFVGGILNGLQPGSEAYYRYYGKRYGEYYIDGDKA